MKVLKYIKFINESRYDRLRSIKKFTAEFNKNILKNELDDIIKDSHNDTKLINELVSHRYIMSLSFDYLKVGSDGVNFRNEKKEPENYFQLECYLHNEDIVWATFIYVNDEHMIDLSKSNIEILDSDYNTIIKLA
jgi:hypothetical protein